MTEEPSTLRLPVSATARETINKLHPAIKDDWRIKLNKIEDETLEHYRQAKSWADDPDQSSF